MRFCLYGLFFITSIQAIAQDDLTFGDTEKTGQKPTYKSNPRKFKQRQIIYIVRNNTKGLLSGNKCFEDYMLSRGYYYLVQNKNQSGSYSGSKRFFHNLRAKSIITLRNGPFWKLTLKKKRRECRRLIHDFMG